MNGIREGGRLVEIPANWQRASCGVETRDGFPIDPPTVKPNKIEHGLIINSYEGFTVNWVHWDDELWLHLFKSPLMVGDIYWSDVYGEQCLGFILKYLSKNKTEVLVGGVGRVQCEWLGIEDFWVWVMDPSGLFYAISLLLNIFGYFYIKSLKKFLAFPQWHLNTLLGFSEWPTPHQRRTNHQWWPVLLCWRLLGRWTYKVGWPKRTFFSSF